MNTNDLIERVAAEHGIAKDHTRKILDSIIAAITAAASAGDEVTLAGFGRFKVADRAERQGRNPATGETMTIAASKKLTFTPAKPVRDRPAGGTAANDKTSLANTARQSKALGLDPSKVSTRRSPWCFLQTSVWPTGNQPDGVAARAGADRLYV